MAYDPLLGDLITGVSTLVAVVLNQWLVERSARIDRNNQMKLTNKKLDDIGNTATGNKEGIAVVKAIIENKTTE